MKTTLLLDNIKCYGCSNSIESKLEQLNVTGVQVDPERGSVSFDTVDLDKLEEIQTVLKKMGYPPQNESGLKEAAKSYVSCMIGRIKTKV